MAWRAARSLLVLRAQVQDTYWWAAPPATPTVSWGLIGNPATHSSDSDHMPHNFPGWGTEIVTALDMPHRPDLGMPMGPIVEAIRTSRDPRVKYVIFARRIYSSYATSSRPAWSWGTYTGSNPHTDHAHVSVVGDSRADGQQPWQIGADDMPTAEEIATAVMQKMLGDPNVQSWMWRIRSIGQLADPIPNTMEEGERNELARALSRIETAVNAPVEVTLTAEQFDALSERIGAQVRAALNATRLTTEASA